MLIISALTLVFSAWYVAVPVRRYYRAEAQRNLTRKLQLYRAWAVKNYYSDLSNLPLEEIEKRFDVDGAYHNMGRRYLRQR